MISAFPTIGGFSYGLSDLKPSIIYPGDKKMGVSLTGAINGAGSGASIGSTGGGIGAVIGGVIGGIAGLFSKPKSTSPSTSGGSTGGGFSNLPTLTGSLGKGLGSLFGGSPSVTVTQSQNVNQSNDVNVTNIIGSQPFGGVNTETGDFDVLKTIGDVFAIRDAQAASFTTDTVIRPSGIVSQGANNNGILIIGAAALALILLLKKGK